MAQPTAQVSEEDLRQAITWIGDSAERIRAIQLKLDQAGVDLKTHWAGESHAAFNKVHLLWHERIDVILGSLARLSEAIRASNANYAEFNATAVQEISQIEALINAAAPASFR